MDGLSGAFAHYDFANGTLVYDDSRVQAKFLVNGTTFPEGFATKDDGWINLWIQGQNTSLGWNGPDEGRGAKELGQMLTQTDAFAECMATKVFEKVCLNRPSSPQDREVVAANAKSFAAGNAFNMKQLFMNTAVACAQY
jgi:hypothetical protein